MGSDMVQIMLLAFSIAEGTEARLELRGRVTQEAIDQLIKLLELQRDTFPSDAIADQLREKTNA